MNHVLISWDLVPTLYCEYQHGYNDTIWMNGLFYMSRPRRNCCHFADDFFKCIFLNENMWILLKISEKFVPKVPINNILSLYPRFNEVERGVYWFHLVRLSNGPSVRLRLWTESCPLCIFKKTPQIHFIFAHLIKQLQKVCHMYSLFQNSKIWNFGNFFKFVNLTSSSFDLGSIMTQ